MVVFECPFCKTPLDTSVERGVEPRSCVACANLAALPLFDDTTPLRVRDDDDDEGITTPENVRAGKKRSNDDDDDDDDTPTKKKSAGGGSAAAAGAGLGIGMILLIVGGIAACCICLPGAGVGVGILALNKIRESAANVHARNNAKQIGMACHNYHDSMKVLPSPRMNPQADLSWRVALLPFVDQQPLYQKFNVNQSWDGPNNRPHTEKMPLVYAMQPTETTPQTKFQYFTGPDTLFPDPMSRRRLTDVTDGTSNTFLFAEAATAVPWAKSADMVVGAGALPLPEGRFIACMCDGDVRIVNRRSASDEVLRLVINPTDNKFPPDRWGE